ncbi:hypothetical protein Cni_G28681 [Canna indica]|uniref:Uncharacterized protein n=1 Tax=Canna indica TaxID=4628 RepID=A0AAQ3L3F8_9LILI|nr:hypothetical protein Cni_G28681 [Canna indica]
MMFTLFSLPLTDVIFTFFFSSSSSAAVAVVASSSSAIVVVSSSSSAPTRSSSPPTRLPPSAVRPLASLLPHPFGPYYLMHKGAPRLLEPHHNELGAVEAAKDNGTADGGLERRLRKVTEGAIIARVV